MASREIKNTTIRDIARLAKVSHTAVSLALDEKKSSRVSPETRKKILEIAERLNYRPHHLARSLATQKTNTIGLVVTNLLNPFYAEMAQDIIDAAKEVGYGVIIASVRKGLEDEKKAVEDLVYWGVDGLIISSCFRRDPVINKLGQMGFPFVLAMRRVDSSPGEPAVPHVGIDNQRGAFLAVEHLLKMGHKRIGLIVGPEDTSTGYDRFLGAQAALKQYGIELDQHLIVYGDFTQQSGYKLASSLLDAKPSPTAIFAMNDCMALGALEALNERGLRAPNDVAVVGFDDIDTAGLRGIDLTTVSQKKEVIGKLAVNLLIDYLQKSPPQVIQTSILEPLMVIRKTCGFPNVRKTKKTGVVAEKDKSN